MKFIYVFNTDDRDALISKGYSLLKSNKRKQIYVFAAKSVVDYSLDGIKLYYSDTLSF